MTVHVFVSGFVQGVGYRRYVRHHALSLGLTGWVKNLSDRRVEALIQGSKEKLEEMIDILRKGPFLSQVRSIAIDFEESKIDYEDFKILT